MKHFILLEKRGKRYKEEIISSLKERLPSYLKEETKVVLKDTFSSLKKEEPIEPAPIKRVAKSIVSEIMQRKNAALLLCNLREADEYTYTHALNVSILSVSIALEMGVTRKYAEEIATGALLHDVGKIFIPSSLLCKERRLTEKEFLWIKKHPVFGAMILEKTFGELPSLIAYQHHERKEGTGYPEGIKGEKIHKYSSLVAVCDVYDALTTDRPYRRRFLPYEAMRLMLASGIYEFNEEIMQYFLKTLSIYPVGSFVKLSTGEVGIVIETNTESLIRPKVLVFYRPDGAPYKEAKEIELSKDNIFIVAAVDEKNL